MNPLRQIPDVSIQIKNQSRTNQENARKESVGEEEHNDKALAVYYDKEFRKWHYKLVFIIGFVLAILCAVLIGMSKFL